MANYLLRSATGLNVVPTERLSPVRGVLGTRVPRPPNSVAAGDLLLTTGLIIDL